VITFLAILTACFLAYAIFAVAMLCGACRRAMGKREHGR
jgi:hypothetical protein